MPDELKVTWLLPVKNGRPFLTETLASIAAQTYQNFEVLAWDNGSTDGTLEELHRYIPALLPGRIISDRPMPLGQCRAEMVKEAKTEFCACIDADDVNLPERLEKQIAFLQKHSDTALVGSRVLHLAPDGVSHGLAYNIPIDHDAIISMFLYSNSIAQPSVLFRRSAVLEVGNYRDVGSVNVEDYDLWMRLATRYRLANLAEPLLKYRIHNNSTTQIAKVQNTLQTALDTRFCEHAPALFGCSQDDAYKLRKRIHPCAVRVLYQIAQFRARIQNVSRTQILCSEDFVAAARHLIAPEDKVSRLVFAVLTRKISIIMREIINVGKDILKRTPLYKVAASIKRSQAIARQEGLRTQWLDSLHAQKCFVHASLTLTGREAPYSYIQMGTGCVLESQVTIWISPDEGADPRLELGERTQVGRDVYFGVYQPISIGKNTMIGAYSYLISATHQYGRRDIPMRDQGYAGAPVIIEEDVWLGTHVVVLPGVTIGQGAIVAAGSIVNKTFHPMKYGVAHPRNFSRCGPSNEHSCGF